MASAPATAVKRDRAVPDWVQIALVNLGAALLVVLAFSDVTTRTPWQKVMEVFGVAYLISTCIGFPCAYLLPSWRTHRRRVRSLQVGISSPHDREAIAGSMARSPWLVFGYILGRRAPVAWRS